MTGVQRKAAGLVRHPARSRVAITSHVVSHWILLCLFLLVLIGLHPLTYPSSDPALRGDGDPARQLSYILVSFLAALHFGALGKPGRLAVLPIGLATLLAWSWLSVIWAIEPGIALRRITLTTLLVITIFLSIERMGTRAALNAIRLSLLITLAANYFAILATPSAIHQFDPLADPSLIGDWRGIADQKNTAGALCAITVILFLFDNYSKSRAINSAIIVLSLFFLWKTDSKTSLILLPIAIMFGALFSWYLSRKSIERTIVLSAFSLAMLAASFLAAGALGSVLDQPDALTGRTQIWNVLVEYAAQHPVLGSGFGSFWNIGPDSPVFEFTRSWVSQMPNGHNGYLDMLAQLGGPGLALTLFALIAQPTWQLASSHTLPRSGRSLIAALMAFCALHNMTETSLMDRDLPVWIFMLVAIAALTKMHREQKKGPGPQSASVAGS